MLGAKIGDTPNTEALESQKKAGNFLIWFSVFLGWMFMFTIQAWYVWLLLLIPLAFGMFGLMMHGSAKESLNAISSNNQGIVVGHGPLIQPSTNGNFSGTWNTDWGELVLIQDGIDIVGNFIGADLSGQVTGRKFFFDWIKEDENISGRGVLAIENGMLVGSWGHDDSSKNGGPIRATLVGVAPEPEETKKPEVWMKGAVIDEGCLRGMVIDHPALGTADNVTTSSIISHDEEGEIHRIETQNTIYLIHEDSWVEKVTSTSEEQAEPEPITSIEQMRQEVEEKKEELSEQIREKVEELEEKVPEEIKDTESFQDMKSSVEETIEQIDEKADEVIEEAVVESVEQIERIEETVIMPLEDSLSQLNDTLERLDKSIMSSDRKKIISELSGTQMNLDMTVERIDSTIGYGIDEELRGGKTIVGKVEGIPHPVSIKVPKSMNDMAKALRKGEKIEHNVALSDFNTIRKMLEFVLIK